MYDCDASNKGVAMSFALIGCGKPEAVKDYGLHPFYFQ